MMYIKVWCRKYVLADVGQENQPWSFVLSTGHVQGSLLPGCDCWSVVQSASVAFDPVIHRVSTLTPTPLLLSSLVDILQAGLTRVCLAWSNCHCCL